MTFADAMSAVLQGAAVRRACWPADHVIGLTYEGGDLRIFVPGPGLAPQELVPAFHSCDLASDDWLTCEVEQWRTPTATM